MPCLPKFPVSECNKCEIGSYWTKNQKGREQKIKKLVVESVGYKNREFSLAHHEFNA